MKENIIDCQKFVHILQPSSKRHSIFKMINGEKILFVYVFKIFIIKNEI